MAGRVGTRGVQRMAQAGLAAGAIALYLDERGLVRPWRWVRHAVRVPARDGEAGQRAIGDVVDLRARIKARPPPIGCTEWPAGRVLLEWAVGEVPQDGARVLEIGAGVGVTSLGLARTLAHSAGGSAGPATAIVATDVCEASLDNLRENARANGIEVLSATDWQAPAHPGCIHIGAWDAAGGDESVRSLHANLGIDPRTLTHVIGGDVIYHGFGDGGANGGLVRTMAALLKANPDIKVTLLLVDRFSGGTVAAVSQVRFHSPRVLTIPLCLRACAGGADTKFGCPAPAHVRWLESTRPPT